MRASRLIGKILGLSLLAVTLLLTVPALTGHPVVSYASSGSMEPTIGVFDAFFVDPWPGELRVGDIVVFDSVTRNGRAVHRIVDGDSSGWITRGDANAGADQEAGEPLLTSDRILGRVITWTDGRPILIDDAGITAIESRAELARLESAVGGPRPLAAIGFLVLAAGSLIPALGRPKRRPPARISPRLRRTLRRLFPRGLRGRHIGAVLLVVLLASTAWAGVQARSEVQTSLVVVANPAAADPIRAAAAGQELSREIRVGSLGILPTIVVLEPASDMLRVEERRVALAPASTTILTVHERAGERVGLQEDTLHVWRYPAFLPAGTILALHDIAPGAPHAVLGAIVASVGAVWFSALGIGNLPAGRLLGSRQEWF